MPHIHGIAWIHQSYLDEKGIDGFLCAKENSKAAVELANKIISCQLPNHEGKSTKDSKAKRGAVEESSEDEESYKHPSLRKIVNEVQIHRHTPSCLKNHNTCRYHFPRLPVLR